VTVHNLLLGAESYYHLSGVIVGSGVAGYLAANGAGHSKRAGMGAGLLGVVPAFAWASDGLRDWVLTSASEGGLVFAAVLLCLLVAATAMIGTLIGVFGGFLGGWIAERVDPAVGG
jgi:hypothetical protein